MKQSNRNNMIILSLGIILILAIIISFRIGRYPIYTNELLGMIWMTQLLYPDQAQYDGYKKASEYYKLFYHTDLTQDQYNKLVANSLGKTEKK